MTSAPPRRPDASSGRAAASVEPSGPHVSRALRGLLGWSAPELDRSGRPLPPRDVPADHLPGDGSALCFMLDGGALAPCRDFGPRAFRSFPAPELLSLDPPRSARERRRRARAGTRGRRGARRVPEPVDFRPAPLDVQRFNAHDFTRSRGRLFPLIVRVYLPEGERAPADLADRLARLVPLDGPR